MSSPELIQHDNGVFYIHWIEGRRTKRLSTRQTSLDKAKTYFGTWLLMEQTPDEDAVFTVADLWSVYFEKHVEPNNAASATAAYGWKNLEVHFGAKRLSEIDDDCVADYRRLRALGKIGRKAANSTVRRELATLRACFNWCAHRKRKIIPPTALPEFDLPPESDARDRWLRHAETQRLIDAAREMRHGERLSRGERFIWLALETAARKGAIFDLTWDRVDFETRVIDFHVPGRRKTKKRRAVVAISDALLPVLQRAYKERLNELVLDNGAEIWATIQRIAARAKVAHVSPHVFRHTAATHMARRGVPLHTIAGVLGNSVAMVEKVYAKHQPEASAEAVAQISGGVLEPAE